MTGPKIYPIGDVSYLEQTTRRAEMPDTNRRAATVALTPALEPATRGIKQHLDRAISSCLPMSREGYNLEEASPARATLDALNAVRAFCEKVAPGLPPDRGELKQLGGNSDVLDLIAQRLTEIKDYIPEYLSYFNAVPRLGRDAANGLLTEAAKISAACLAITPTTTLTPEQTDGKPSTDRVFEDTLYQRAVASVPPSSLAPVPPSSLAPLSSRAIAGPQPQSAPPPRSGDGARATAASVVGRAPPGLPGV